MVIPLKARIINSAKTILPHAPVSNEFNTIVFHQGRLITTNGSLLFMDVLMSTLVNATLHYRLLNLK